METRFLNFKRMTVTGATKDEALAKAPFYIMGDATQAYRNFTKEHPNGFSDSELKEWMLGYLAKRSKNSPNNGFSITVESPVVDSRQRPYRINDVKNEEGPCKYVRTYQIIDNVTGAIIAETPAEYVQDTDKDGNLLFTENGDPKMVWKPGTKAQAKDLVRSLYTDGGLRSNVTCIRSKQIVEGTPTAFTAEYTPSKGTRIGTYIVFGIENS
jgi:hypothetical protein